MLGPGCNSEGVGIKDSVNALVSVDLKGLGRCIVLLIRKKVR